MTLEALKQEVDALDGTSRDELLRYIALAQPPPDTRVVLLSIRHTPGVCGGRACIGYSRIPVWLLESYRRQGATSLELVKAYPSLSLDAIELAWQYARENLGEIEQDIWENSDAALEAEDATADA